MILKDTDTNHINLNFEGNVGNIVIRAVAGDANSRTIVVNIKDDKGNIIVDENDALIVRFFVKKPNAIEYVDGTKLNDGEYEIIIAPSMLETTGVYKAQISVLEKDGEDTAAIIQSRIFNLIVERSISSLEAVEGTAGAIDIAGIGTIASDIADLKNRVDNIEGVELPPTPPSPSNKFLNGNVEWVTIDTIQGEAGKNAYEMARDDGFVGTYEEWKESLKGEKGDVGKNAYQLAQDDGFSGTYEEWKESLKGQDGDPGTTDYEALENKPDLSDVHHGIITISRTENYVDLRFTKRDGDKVIGRIPHASYTDAGVVSASDYENIRRIKADGDGSKFLSDQGVYKEIDSIELVQCSDEQDALAQSQGVTNKIFWW